MSIKILLDPGHGGLEPGASSNGYIEKDLNLQVSLILRDELKRCGFEVIMSRESDLNVPLDVRGKRAVIANCNSIISVHFNSMGQPNKGRGFEAIFSINNSAAKWLAECITKEAVKLGMFNRGIWTKESDTYKGRNWYGVLREAEPVPGVILEGLFLDNTEDVKFLKQPDFLRKLAIAYCKGICGAYSIAYVSEPVTQPQPPQQEPNIKQQIMDQYRVLGDLINKL